MLTETYSEGSGSLRHSGAEKVSDRFYSVEFEVNGLNMLYQTKIWNSPSASMFALIKENSDILNRIRVGDVLNMKYYTTDALRPIRQLDTKIEYITRDRKGRFRGHYLIGLAILPHQNAPMEAVCLS